MGPWNTYITLFLVLNLLSLSRRLVIGGLLNITVDDTNPDPFSGQGFLYDPVDLWNIGNQCSGCLAQPDPARTYDGTWHDATSTPSLGEVQTASFQFNGSALYVYGILSHSTANPTSAADIYFFIDNQDVGHFTYTPPDPGNSTYTYNALLYANDSIPAGIHSFKLQNGLPTGIVSLVLFDYVIYTQDIDDAVLPSTTLTSSSSTIPTSSSSTTLATSSSATLSDPPSTGQTNPVTDDASAPHLSNIRTIIVSAVVPFIVLMIVVVALIYVRRRRILRKRQRAVQENEALSRWEPRAGMGEVTPYTGNSDSSTGLLVVSETKGRNEDIRSANSTPGPSQSVLRADDTNSVADSPGARLVSSSGMSEVDNDPPPAYASEIGEG